MANGCNTPSVHQSAKKYKLRIYYGAVDKRGTIDVLINKKIVAENVYLPATGGMKKWKSIDFNNLPIGNGDQIRIKVDRGGFNLKQLEFISAINSSSPGV